MSLINKMLQDLDARGGSGDGGLRQQQLHAVGGESAGRSKLVLGGAVLGLGVLIAAGAYGWQYWQAKAASGSAPLAMARPVLQGKDVPAPVAAPAPVVAQEAVATPTQPASVPVVAAAAASAVVPAPSPVSPAQVPAPVSAAPASISAAPAPAQAAAQRNATRAEAATSDVAPASTRAERKAARIAATRSNEETAEAGTITHNLSPKLMAENTYRRGLVALQEGRINAALTDLERALEIDPRNEAARQTYISLLLENKRNDDAVRQLRLALGLDPRQPGLAMILARLQLEKGGPALQTLLTTLPYVGNNAEYHAFLAGVLQREQRHGEAAQHYRDALQLAPQNGVWWMGLGISLQADNHLAEAREAFRRARGATGLSAELLAFIDRKIESLSR